MQVAPVPHQGSLPGRQARTGRQQCAVLTQSDRLATVCECGFLCWTKRPLLGVVCARPDQMCSTAQRLLTSTMDTKELEKKEVQLLHITTSA